VAAGAGLQYGFAAAFVHLRSITLQGRAGARLRDPSDVAGTPPGHYWIVDAAAADVKVFGPEGRLRHVLRGGPGAVALCGPASVTAFHGSWVAVLDAGAGRVALYDGRARRLGGFDLLHVEEPLQIRNLGDRWLAVLGRGSGRAAGRWVHLYRPDGRHEESFFSLGARGRAGHGGDGPAAAHNAAPPNVQSAAAGQALWIAYEPGGAAVVYDLTHRLVHCFPLEPAPPGEITLCGLFPAPGGRVIVMRGDAAPRRRFLYQLYTAAGELVMGDLRSPQRLVGVEGRLFYAIEPAEADDGLRLRICRLREGL
jgi:hypothetical protein